MATITTLADFIDKVTTVKAITIAFKLPENYDSVIATAPGAGQTEDGITGTITITDTTTPVFAVRLFKTNQEVILKDGESITLALADTDPLQMEKALYYRNFATLNGAGVKVSVGDNVVDPASVATFGDEINDTKDIITPSTLVQVTVADDSMDLNLGDYVASDIQNIEISGNVISGTVYPITVDESTVYALAVHSTEATTVTYGDTTTDVDASGVIVINLDQTISFFTVSDGTKSTNYVFPGLVFSTDPKE
jgi:hypothetical protein